MTRRRRAPSAAAALLMRCENRHMTVFTEFERDPDADVGVMFEDFIKAVGIFVYTNENAHRSVNIADVATAFNTTPDLVREAVAIHPWLHSVHNEDPALQTIESDGE